MMKRCLLVLFGITLTLLGITTITDAQGTADQAQYWITDLTGANVVSDGTSRYRDYRLTGGDPCVSATASSKWGYSVLWPQRPDCTTAQPRRLRYYLPPEIAGIQFFQNCALVDPGPDGTPGTGDDRLYVEDVKRIISDTLFLKGALTNGADLRFGFYCGGWGLSIEMDQNIPVQKLSDTSRRVTNFGAVTASLYYIENGNLVHYPGAPTGFAFNFDITVEQVPPSKPPRR